MSLVLVVVAMPSAGRGGAADAGSANIPARTITTAITLETGKGDFALGIALGLLLLLMSFALNAALSFLRRRAEV
ncbi:hypothetical protein FACS1894167_08530 [Synergistales bacterium]|nr:hypothetical protein FACS1894167_08530 [Synergistales bacterium]